MLLNVHFQRNSNLQLMVGNQRKKHQLRLRNVFGDRMLFTKFRVIDAYDTKSNFLAEGPVALKKILFSASDELFNNARSHITDLKTERERYNRDEAVIYKHYPSQKRLDDLTIGLDYMIQQFKDMNNSIMQNDDDSKKLKIKISQSDTKCEYLRKQIGDVANVKTSYDAKIQKKENEELSAIQDIENSEEQLKELDSQTETVVKTNMCYVCKRPLEEHSQKEILEERAFTKDKIVDNIGGLKKQIIMIQGDIQKFKAAASLERLKKVEDFKTEIETLTHENELMIEEVMNIDEILAQDRKSVQFFMKKKDKLATLKMQLEGRLKQKAYIYTTRDVLVAKKSIEELDRISSTYLVSTVRTLEPIINSILVKIKFTVKFDVNEKGKV